jgi:hypothetical protein
VLHATKRYDRNVAAVERTVDQIAIAGDDSGTNLTAASMGSKRPERMTVRICAQSEVRFDQRSRVPARCFI